MGAIELAAAALIAAAFAVCVLAVVATAADAGRIAARRLQDRAEARAAQGAPPPGGGRQRDVHGRFGRRGRPSRRRG